MPGANLKGKPEVLLLAASIASITLTEYFFAFVNPAIGIFSALVSVTALYLALALLKRINWAVRETVEIICLLQIYTLLISSLPWFFISQSLLIPATYSILLALCLWQIKESNIPLEELGFRKAPLKYMIPAAAVGIPLGVLEFQVLRPPPPTPTFSTIYFLQTLLYMHLFVGFGEELLFRGLLMSNLEKYTQPKTANLLQSLVFAILHLTWRSTIELIFVFAAGIIFGILFKKSKSLLPPTIAHGIGNTVLLSILPYLT